MVPSTPAPALPERIRSFPRLRYMGSKYRLLPWIHAALEEIPFTSALDPFCGSGAVAYLLKAMGKRVTASDFLHFPSVVARALVANDDETLSPETVERLAAPAGPADSDPAAAAPPRTGFIERTFDGIFFETEDLAFLDRVWARLDAGDLSAAERALALTALLRSCAKRQPRGVFTVAGDPERYKDGRRDLQLSIEEHFREQVPVVNDAVFAGPRGGHRALHADAFAVDPSGHDLVYLDPPYVPRSDDNCYMKRYHFLEGLSRNWRGVSLMEDSVVKKIEKPDTPFSYRSRAREAFAELFERFRRSILVLSYSSNGWPDLEVLVEMLERVKGSVTVHRRDHRYHFGTHPGVRPARAAVEEYLLVGR